MVMETEIILFKRHAEMLGPDLLLPIQILFNIRLLLGKKKNHSRRYFQLGKIIDIVNSDTFLCVVIKDS